MKIKHQLLCWLFTTFFLSFTALGEQKIQTGIYEYVYEYNTLSLIENHYIKLVKKGGIIVGRYYGTSDDFDDAREGYLPGFFSAEMNNLQIEENTISFEIKPDKFFEKAVTPLKQNKKNTIWDMVFRYNKRFYQGTYHDGKIVIQTDGLDDRVFVKIK